jgi:hypothetical protein
MRTRCIPVSIALLALTAGQACDTAAGPRYQDVQRQLQLSQEKIEQLEKQTLKQSSQIKHLQDEAARLRGLDRQDFDQLIVPVKIQLEGQSGGYDTDGQPGDDGLVLYIQPIDADGHVIKAAGALRVRLLDLAAPADRMELAPYHFDVPTTRGLWYGRMWTHHWTVRCPWPPNRLPEHDEITARIEFTDLLTGRILTTQEAYKVVLPVRKAERNSK